MNQPTLHTGLAQLLEISGVKSQCPDVAFFSAFIPGEHDVLGSGISALVKFRLLYPETPVLFFSFLAKEHLLPKDEFGVLHLPRTEFIQLPCADTTIIQLAEKHGSNSLVVSSVEWLSFSEKACQALIQRLAKKISHQFGEKGMQLGNKALNPLRMNCCGLLSSPHLKEDYMPLLQKNFVVLNEFMAIPEIAELLNWCMISPDSKEEYLQCAYSFSTLLKQLSSYSAQTDAKEIISLIDRVNDSFEKLQPE